MRKPKGPTRNYGLNLYRVFPWFEDAEPGEPGHPLYISPFQGNGRIDNPEDYLVFYAADRPEAAIAEAFGNRAKWTEGLFVGPPILPSSRNVLARYRAEIQILDLDDPKRLTERALRPSRVVTRRREVTQAWALRIFEEKNWVGVRWWSYYNPDWGSFGLWDQGVIEVEEIAPLSRDTPAVIEASRAILRPFE